MGKKLYTAIEIIDAYLLHPCIQVRSRFPVVYPTVRSAACWGRRRKKVEDMIDDVQDMKPIDSQSLHCQPKKTEVFTQAR